MLISISLPSSSSPSPMALCINPTSHTHFSLLLPNTPKSSSLSLFRSCKRSSHITCAKKFSSKTGRFDSKNKKTIGGGGLSTTTTKEEVEEEFERVSREEGEGPINGVDDGYFLPELPGDKTDPFEGAQWDALGFFVQYLWAFGIIFALVACGIAVATYNEGATDFKQTTVYKEAIQSRDLLEEPETSNSDVFEGNPTEEAPSLE